MIKVPKTDIAVKKRQTREQLIKRIGRLEGRIKESKAHPYPIFVDKLPDYFYSFSGYYIINKWIHYNGLNRLQAELLVVISYYKYMTRHDLQHWNMLIGCYQSALDGMFELGYVTYIEIPARVKGRVRKAIALTQKGRDFESDYEKYYEQVMTELVTKVKYSKPNTRVRFDDGQYFRRVKILKFERRAAQGGGKLPTTVKKSTLYREVGELNKGKNGEAEHRESE